MTMDLDVFFKLGPTSVVFVESEVFSIHLSFYTFRI